jgi:citrate lyase subunit beta / citryl-CoA lyase
MPTQFRHRPRRSALYTPGANPRALEKTSQIPADVFIIDLEDAVAPESKHEARQNVTSFFENRATDAREIIIRVNGLDTEWCADDLQMVVKLAPDGVLFPKINSAADVARAEALLSATGAAPSLQLWCMIETPLSIINLHAIAHEASKEGSRMSVWIMGTNDLVKELRALHTPDRTPMLYALSAAVNAARAYGIGILDGVHNDIADGDGLKAACVQGRALGFDGKTVIHPSQIAACQEHFSPSAEDVTHARHIIEAFAQPENAGKGVLRVNGKMVELLHAEIARDLITVANSIAELGAAQAPR